MAAMTISTSPRRSYKQLSLQQLRSFAEVCDRRGYAAAARALLLTSPAIWEQVKMLEHHYGLALVERHDHEIRPTREGSRLLDLVRPLLAGLDSTREVLKQQNGALPEQVTLVTNLRVLAEEVSRAMRRFQRRFPNMRLRVFYTDIGEVEPRLLRGEADVAFTLEPGPDSPWPTNVTYEPAGEVDFLLVTPARHPLLRKRVLNLHDIVRHPLILGEPGAYSRRRVQEVLHRHNLTRSVSLVVETSSDEYTLSCVRAGMGVGITVGTERGRLHRGLGVRSLERWFGTARVGFLWKRGCHVPLVQRELAMAIRVCLER
jgi:DNA-binding transcriptional LysR family regulator